MGKRSRKRPPGPLRTGADPEAPARAPASRPVVPSARRPGQSRVDRFIERADERPKPPWHPVPLVELSVLVGLILLIFGVLNHDSSRGRIAMVFGLALASVAGLDTALREHFNGYRSHSTLLAGLPAIVTVAVLAFASAPFAVLILAGGLVFALGFWGFRNAFRKRAGVAFKV